MPRCPAGTILREGYTRRAYTKSNGTRVRATYVDAVCIEDRGNPGRGPSLIGPLEKGDLTSFGYHLSNSDRSRHIALGRVLEQDDARRVFRKLIALSTLQKNTNPRFSNVAYNDAYWVKDNYYFD